MARTRYRPAPKPAPIVGVDLLVREEPQSGRWIVELFVDGYKVETLERGPTLGVMAARANELRANYPDARIRIDEWSGATVRAGHGLGRSSEKGAPL